MIRSLLEERFKLKAHRETRELPIYELVVARADRRLGPEMRKPAADCDAAIAAGIPPPRQPGEPPPCGLMGGPARTIAGGATMQQLAANLSVRAGTARHRQDRPGRTVRLQPRVDARSNANGGRRRPASRRSIQTVRRSSPRCRSSLASSSSRPKGRWRCSSSTAWSIRRWIRGKRRCELVSWRSIQRGGRADDVVGFCCDDDGSIRRTPPFS